MHSENDETLKSAEQLQLTRKLQFTRKDKTSSGLGLSSEVDPLHINLHLDLHIMSRVRMT